MNEIVKMLCGNAKSDERLTFDRDTRTHAKIHENKKMNN